MKKLRIIEHGERTFSIKLDEKYIAPSLTYDDLGWAGLDACKELAKDLAREAGWEVSEE